MQQRVIVTLIPEKHNKTLEIVEANLNLNKARDNN